MSDLGIDVDDLIDVAVELIHVQRKVARLIKIVTDQPGFEYNTPPVTGPRYPKDIGPAGPRYPKDIGPADDATLKAYADAVAPHIAPDLEPFESLNQ